jgi:hypothetical protein
MNGLSKAVERLKDYWDRSRDNFDRNVSNELKDIIELPGEKDFTPERYRYFVNGNRRFLMYGDDANYSETQAGRLLTPDAGMTQTFRSAERAFYPVGNDLWVSIAQAIPTLPDEGDAVISGYGDPNIQNYNPDTRTWGGTTADGYLGIFDADTGTDTVHEVIVQSGTVVYRNDLELRKDADILSIFERQLNWYDVGQSVLKQSFTAIDQHPNDPQQNRTIGATAVDDGQAAALGSQRPVVAVTQAEGNTGLEVEVGSMGIRTPGPAEPNYKTKAHRITATVSTTDTWQAVGAIRGQPSRNVTKLRLNSINILSTAGSNTNTRVLVVSVDRVNTNATDIFNGQTHADLVPNEHSKKNSVVEQIVDNTITVPIEDDPGTDVTGAVSANTADNPGGYQIGNDSFTTETAQGNQTVFEEGITPNRELNDRDVGVILVQSAETGDVDLSLVTGQNS